MVMIVVDQTMTTQLQRSTKLKILQLFYDESLKPIKCSICVKKHLKGEFNLDIMSQSGYWSYISVNNFHPLVVAFPHKLA